MVPPVSRHIDLSVSVVMCTYNGAAFVAEQLQSILQQTYPLKEILIFDDASIDETVDILQNIAASHAHIHLHFNEVNIGFTRNFEQAMLAATSDAIAIADQDDVWKNTKIEKMVTAWQPGVPLIYCDSVRFSKTPHTDAKLPYNYRRYEGSDARKLFLFNTVSGHALMIKRTFLQIVLPFHSEVMYDWWMAVAASYNGGVQYLPEVLVYQRIHNSNVSIVQQGRHSTTKLKLLYKTAVIENCLLFSSTPNIPEKHKIFALQFADLNKKSLSHAFYKPLFFFIMRYRKLLFNYKVRRVGLISHIKHSYRRTKN